jgi:NADPH-dependent 2,4-dienoyl-CoA reductase/sulfur reductase-like enzyme
MSLGKDQKDPNVGKRIVVVGGSAAGPKAAARARRLDEQAEIMILQQAEDLSMASCGYPYYVGGVFDDRNQLLCTPAGAVRNPSFFLKAKGIVARTATEVTSIDRTRCVVSARNLKTKGFFRRVRDEQLVKKAGIIGGGLIGIETCEALLR